MTGIYLRVKRSERWCSLDIVEMTDEEITAAMEHRPAEELTRWVVALATSNRANVVGHQVLAMLAARAVAHCPRDLAEALCDAIGIPMPQGFIDKPSAINAWAGTSEDK